MGKLITKDKVNKVYRESVIYPSAKFFKMEQSKMEQSKMEQSKMEQSKMEQSKMEQSMIEKCGQIINDIS